MVIRGGAFEVAGPAEVARVAASLVAARVFADEDEVMATHAAETWRLRTSPDGDLAVLDRWRDHLDLLSLEALWCAERAIPARVGELHRVVRAMGFEDLLSPPVPIAQVYAYEAAGMHVRETASSWSLRLPAVTLAAPHAVEGVTLRVGTRDDLDAVRMLDGHCFEPFWHYDMRHLERLLVRQRMVVAEGGNGLVGYTLATLDRGDAGLGRLAVAPSWRRRGVGRMLVAEVVRWAGESDALRLALCTQTHNAPARHLYRSLGFLERVDRFAFLQFGAE
jgi:ribosomal protein S18 acetylase RimI-like enzyme